MKCVLGCLAICCLAMTGPGCSDDDSVVVPPEFQVTIQVTDPEGLPVEGLDMSLVSDTPFYQDGQKGPDYRPAVIIPVELEQESAVRLTIEDIEGTEVRLVWETTAPAGVHHLTWEGLDDNQVRLASGVYTAHLVAMDRETDEVILDDRADMLMAIMDPMRMSVGTTDAEGRIILQDKRLFPHLYDPADIPAVNENAEPIGNIRLTPLMRFMLADLTNGGSMRFDREITGPTTLDFVWDVSKAGFSFQARPVETAVPIVPLDNDLGQPYPCPFN